MSSYVMDDAHNTQGRLPCCRLVFESLPVYCTLLVLHVIMSALSVQYVLSVAKPAQPIHAKGSSASVCRNSLLMSLRIRNCLIGTAVHRAVPYSLERQGETSCLMKTRRPPTEDSVLARRKP